MTGSHETIQHLYDYYPYGEILPSYGGQQKFLTTENERDLNTGLDYRHYRYSNPEVGRFLSVDPLADKFPNWSPYNYTENNPVNKIDPLGLSASPIYDTEGYLLGTDDQGLQGNAIIMDKDKFSQGMKHEDALKNSKCYCALKDDAAKNRFSTSYNSLKSRPDYDGFVSIQEGIAWAKLHPGAMGSPTPENTLYIDASQLDFGNISISDFINGVGNSSPINLNTFGNFTSAGVNNRLAATVYALARVDITLLDNNGRVKIVNNEATDYDWNRGGSYMRRGLINYERWSENLNDTHGFKTLYYGIGQLRP